MILNAWFGALNEGRPFRGVFLKGRQQGCSTGVGGIGHMCMMCKPGTNLLIATEEKQASGKNIYNMYRTYNEKFPIQYPVRAHQSNEIIEFGEELNNGLIRVSGERKVTSFTYQFIHLSEAAMFMDLGKFLEMMLETVPLHLLETSIFIESTADSYGDQFNELWLQAQQNEKDKIGWQPVFIPWWVHEEYEYQFKDERDKNEFAESLNTTQEAQWGDEAALMTLPHIAIPTTGDEVRDVGISLEKLRWRRDKIAVMQMSKANFFRQYPSTWEEAFLHSVLSVLDRDALGWYTQTRVHDEVTGEKREPVKSGEFFERDEVSMNFLFEEGRDAIVNIFEDVKEYHEYILGADLAQGLETGDFSCGIVICRLPLRVVARLRGMDGRRLDPSEFARQLYALGQYFGNAWICPENNADGGAVSRLLLDWGYPKLVQESMITGQSANRYGWRNTSVTKKRMIGELQRHIREKTIDITDEVVIEEAKHLVYRSGQSTTGSNVQAAKKGNTRRPGSPPTGYYDDTIFALGGVLLAESVLPAAKTPRTLQQQERMDRMKERDRERSKQYDENDWLNYC